MSENDQSRKVSYETPVVLDHGSISDHTFRRCITLHPRGRPAITICFPGGGGGGLS